ncbi:MAG: DNRLRE domain-containing protein, partial [Thermoleophilia bacterium]
MIESHTGAVNTRRHHIYMSLKWVLAVFAAAFMFSVAIASFLVSPGEAVVGPEGSYTEANGDIIEICADAACTNHTNTFTKGAVVYVKVTTTRVPNNFGSGGDARLRNYLNTQVGTTGTWTQTSSVSPYVYTSAVTIPAASANYLKVAASVVSNTGPRVTFEEALDISAINQFIHFYSDNARTDESYTFRPGATMYIRAYGNGSAYSSSQTGTNNRMFDFTNATKATWAAPAVTQAGNNYDFPLTLPSSGLVDGNWYWVRTFLRNSGAGTIERTSRMIQIDATNPVASISSPAANAYLADSIPVNGTAADSTSFYNYKIEYGAGASPSSWTQIGTTSYSPVSAGLLQDWDTTTMSDGLYTLRLSATDRAYNTGAATVQVNVDNTPPEISGVLTNSITSSSATVTWNTDEVTDSQVEYGTSPGDYTNSTTLDPALVTSHNQALANLNPSTDYYYRVRSNDRTGHTTYSSEYTLRTANITVLQPYAATGRDTTFESNQPAWNRGAANWLVAGDFSVSDWGTARSLVRYDLSWMPPSATIQSANMSLYQMSQGSAAAVSLDVHQITAHDWTEGTGAGSATGDGATWATYNGVQPWSAAGGDLIPAPAGSATAPNSTSSWVSWDIKTLTQAWVGGTPNYGVIVKQNTENPAVDDYKTYYSSDYKDDRSLRPKLVIEWFGADATGPNIGEVRAEGINRTSASIKWSTDEGSDSQVEYGTTTSYGSSTVLDAAILNQHTVLLPGLTEDTVYHYRVKSTDSFGNQNISGDSVFQTARLIIIVPDATAGNDTWISSTGTNINYGSSSDISLGNNADFAENRRGLLKFNLASIPTGSTINSATLSLHQYAQADTSTPQYGIYCN